MGLITRAKLLNAIARLERAGVSVDRAALSRIAAEAELLGRFDFREAAQLAKRLREIVKVDRAGTLLRAPAVRLSREASSETAPLLGQRTEVSSGRGPILGGPRKRPREPELYGHHGQRRTWDPETLTDITPDRGSLEFHLYQFNMKGHLLELTRTREIDFVIRTNPDMNVGRVAFEWGGNPWGDGGFKGVIAEILGAESGGLHIHWIPDVDGKPSRLVVKAGDREGQVLLDKKSLRPCSEYKFRVADQEIVLRVPDRAAPASTQDVTPRAPK